MLRPYNTTDRTACIQIFKGNCPEYFDMSELEFFEMWLDGQDEGRNAYKVSTAEKYFVVEEEGKIIGCGGYYAVSDEMRAGMAWGMIHRDFHKQGFGEKLLQFRLDAIRESYPEHKILLDTSQRTYGFFERFGFVVTKITPDGFAEGIDKYDMVRR